MTKFIKMILVKTETFGATIRKLRTEKDFPLRKVAAHLDMDQGILSKIERGQRKIQRAQVVKIARFFKVDSKKMLLIWLSDEIVLAAKSERFGLEALKIAQKKMKAKK